MEFIFKDLNSSDIFNNYIAFYFLMIDVPIFISLFLVKVYYGKFYNSEIEELNWFQRLLRKYFPVISSKKAWIIQASPGVFVTLFYIVYTFIFSNMTFKKILVIIPFLIHYIHRAFIFPFCIHSSDNIPLEITLLIFIACFFNAVMINRSIFYFCNYDKEFWIFYIFGLISFGIGAFINIFSDYSMAKQRRMQGLNGQYIIPRGFLFEYISCPNYFGEIIEWLSFMVLSSSFSGFIFFITNISFLYPRAIHIHEWYKEYFKNEFNNDKGLSERKAILPFLF